MICRTHADKLDFAPTTGNGASHGGPVAALLPSLMIDEDHHDVAAALLCKG